MLVTLIGKNNIIKLTLPKFPEGSYWINDVTGKKIINIQGKFNQWQIISSDFAKIINSQYIKFSDNVLKVIPSKYTTIKNIVLKEYSMHFISIGNNNEIYVLYCSPVCENEILHFDIKNFSEISIGKSASNDISYNNTLMSENHARIFYNDGKWNIKNYDKMFGTYVNGEQIYEKEYELKNGDVIFILGLKIILIGNSIYINNPMNKVKYLLKNLMLNKSKNELKDEPDGEETELYTEDDYFSRAPRIVDKIEEEKMIIDGPPSQREENQMPLILSMGASLSMGVMMVLSSINLIDGYTSKTADSKEIIMRLVMTLSMLIGMIVIPIISRKYQEKLDRKYEKERQQKYKKYINSKIMNVNEIMEKQHEILANNFVSANECERIILEKDSRLWERKIEEHDFLTIRAGTGDVPLNIDVQYPRDSFSMADDELINILNTIGQASKILEDAPITISLVQKNVSAIIKNKSFEIKKYIKSIITQLVALHSYSDLKLVFLLDNDKDENWSYVKFLPHVWNETRTMRFFSYDNSEMKQISRYLEDVLEERKEYAKDKYDYKSFMPYYLIITDNYKKIENLKIIVDILKLRKNLGFSLLCITNNLTQLPNECKAFINIEDETSGIVFENENSSTTQKKFKIDIIEDYDFGEISRKLANIPIRYSLQGSIGLPENYSFLEMYDVGRIEQLNVYERWTSNDSTASLEAPIGIDAQGMQVVLDAHEKFHGPHGLIAGSTGSGKSEFIITYILSLAINYHPNDVNFILIDYKGGGLAGAFEKKHIKLPHLVGSITNIDTIGLKRSLESIQSELRRRQVMFNKAKQETDESTIDIYKYQRLYHDGILKTPIPHLFIICDEFAELKQQQQDFMDELISVSRIGRSLGVHLILATQKPAGIVNDQIRSNSKFGVCLKVQSKQDSSDVINRPDAVTLKKAGQFYMNVGNEEVFVLGQSGYAGAPYYPQDIYKKKVDTAIDVVSNIGSTIKKIDNVKTKKIESNGDQLTNIVKYISDIAKEKGIQREKLWLDSIPENIYVDELKEKYNYKIKKDKLEVVVGEYDDPSNQKQGLLNIDFTNNGNLLIYGSAGSGKETMLSTIIYDSMKSYSTKDVNFYILDFGSEVLKIYKKSPHVGDIVLMNDDEKIDRLIEMIENEIKRRKSILAEYNGDYELYKKTTKKVIPMFIIIINNYSAFYENYEKYEDRIQSITRECIKFRVNFIITATSYRDLRYRLAQNFKQKITLQLNNDDEYIYIYEKIGKKRPSHLFGRGLVQLDGAIYEFQTAKVCEADKIQEKIKKQINIANKVSKVKAKEIPVMPDRVMFKDIKRYIKTIQNVPIGISVKSLKVNTFNFKEDLINLILARSMTNLMEYMKYFYKELSLYKDINIYDFNTETRSVSEMQDELIKLNNEKINELQKIVIIIGIDKFVNNVLNGKEMFGKFVKEYSNIDNFNFIIVESESKIKNYQYDEWYRTFFNNDNGIWVGNGLNDQYIYNISNRKIIENNCDSCMGYTIKKGNITFLKFLGLIKEEKN